MKNSTESSRNEIWNEFRIKYKVLTFLLVSTIGFAFFFSDNIESINPVPEVQESFAGVIVDLKQEASEVNIQSKSQDIELMKIEMDVDKIACLAKMNRDQTLEYVHETKTLKDISRGCTLHREVLKAEISCSGGFICSKPLQNAKSNVELRYIEEDPLQKIELDANGLEFPKVFQSKVYPNPAREATSLEVKLPSSQEQLVINLYDMSGSHIQSVYDGEMNRGTHTYQLNLIDLKPGMYLVTILSADFKETVRISKS